MARPHRLTFETPNVTQPTVMSALGVSANGRYAITGDEAGLGRVFELATGRTIAELPVPPAFRASARRIARAWVGDDGAWAALELGERRTLVMGPTSAWSPATFDGQHHARAAVSADGRFGAQTIGLRLLTEGREVRNLMRDHAVDCAFSADGLLAALARANEREGQVQCFDARGIKRATVTIRDDLWTAKVGFSTASMVLVVTKTGRVHRVPLSAAKPSAKKLGVRVLRDGTRLAPSDGMLLAPLEHVLLRGERAFELVSLRTGKVSFTTKSELWACSADGQVVLSAEGGELVRHHPRTFEPLVPSSPRQPVTGLGFTAEGTLWAGADERLTHWRVDDQRADHTITLAPQHVVSAISTSGTAALVTSLRAHRSRVVELPSGSLGPVFAGASLVAAMSHDGAIVSAADDKGRCVRWNAASGKPVRRHPEPAMPIHGTAFASAADVFVGSDARGTTWVWDRQGLVASFRLPTKTPARGIALAPDASSAIVGVDGSKAFLVHLPLGKVRHVLDGLKGRGDCRAAFSPNGRWVAVANAQSTVVWDVATGKRHLRRVGPGYAIAFSHDSTRLAVGGVGEVLVFEL